MDKHLTNHTMTKNELKNIWSVPKYLPYLQPDLTDEILEKAENQIGFKLPQELVEILKIQNGGYLRYKLPDSTLEKISGVGAYFPSLIDFDWEEDKEYVSFELDGLVPIDGDGHWYICLDYRDNKDNPKVTWIDIECDNQEEIANSFTDFLALLELDVENELVIETTNSIEITARQIEEILNIKFEAPDYFAYGYATYRSKFKDSWIWLKPNKVPVGFVREDDKRYDELKDQMSITSVQHIEISESSLFLELSEENLNGEVMDKLIKNNVIVEPIKEVIAKNNMSAKP